MSRIDDIAIIDAHHHLWDLDHLNYPSLSGPPRTDFFLGDNTPIRRNYLPEDYRKDSAKHNVIGTVHCEAECHRDFQVQESEWIMAMSARYGFPNAIVGHAWLDRDNSEEILAKQAAIPLMRGIRSKPVTASSKETMTPGAAGTMQDDRWLEGFALLEKYDLSWDLRVPTWHLEEAAEVARAFPGTRINLNHTGFPWDRSPAGLDMWRRGMHALAACPNVVTKISCLCLLDGPWLLEDNRPIVLETIDIFGVDRCMFASNYPVDGLRASYDMIYDSFKTIVAGFPRADQEKLFSGNAAAFYRIDL
ncbi:MAG: amidohydrolase family protein [Proteobacteria bacterium]|nr:amidohydrolase family protein [Pseudomonadota bacterium]